MENVKALPKKSSKKKKPSDNVILVDKRAFLSAMQLTSHVLQALGDEFEMLRSARDMPTELRKALLQTTGIHLQNVAHVSTAFQMSLFDPVDPDGTKARDLN